MFNPTYRLDKDLLDLPMQQERSSECDRNLIPVATVSCPSSPDAHIAHGISIALIVHSVDPTIIRTGAETEFSGKNSVSSAQLYDYD